MLAGFVEFNIFSMLAGYQTEMENMLSQLNVRAESEEIRQFPYYYHDNGSPISGKRGEPWRSMMFLDHSIRLYDTYTVASRLLCVEIR